MCCSLCEIFSAQEHLGITPPDGRRGCPAFRAARPTHVSFEAEMPQNVVAAQKVRARPPPPLGRSPARPPSLREIFEATPDWASYKRGMRSPRTPRARASRLDRALTSPPRSNTQAIQAAKGYVHFRGSSLVRLPRPRCARLGNKTPSWEQRAHGSSPAARTSLVPGCARRLLLSVFRPTRNRNTRAPPDPPPPPPARRTP